MENGRIIKVISAVETTTILELAEDDVANILREKFGLPDAVVTFEITRDFIECVSLKTNRREVSQKEMQLLDAFKKDKK